MTREEFLEKFLIVFSSGVSKKQKRKIGISGKFKGYLWHLFSYKLIPCFEGDIARDEYNKVDKSDAIEIQFDHSYLDGKNYIGCEGTMNLDESRMTADGIDKSGYPEFYIIGKNFSWCYVITHEFDLCGPYFCYAPVNEK